MSHSADRATERAKTQRYDRQRSQFALKNRCQLTVRAIFCAARIFFNFK